MSAQSNTVTPRLKAYMSAKNLLQYTTELENCGFLSIDTFQCLPPEEDANFVKEININNVLHRISFRTMINEIRRDVYVQNNKCIINIPPINTNAIDLTTEEQIPKSETIQNIQNSYNSDNNAITDTNESNEQHYRKLTAKLGQKEEYTEGDKVTFFFPEDADNGIYIDRNGTIKSKISALIYEIIDSESPNSDVYTVQWSLILRDSTSSNVDHSNDESVPEMQQILDGNENYNNDGQSNCIRPISFSSNSNNSDMKCFLCNKIWKPVKVKDIYGQNGCSCDAIGCTKELKGNDIIFHCGAHRFGFDLCDHCISINEHKPITKARSSKKNILGWKQWEEDYILKCNKQYQKDVSLKQKYIEISHKLSKYTEKMKQKGEPKPPWRTTESVKNKLGNLSKRKHKKRKKKTDDNDRCPESKKHRQR
eukprot:231547_1